jgi:nucleoside-diphosphate-sugar epimerase
MLKVLITGGAGFLGSSLADRLLKDERYSLVLVDNLLTGDIKKIPLSPRCEFLQVDVNNFQEIATVFKQHQFDYVFHYAAVVGVKRTLSYPLMVMNDIEGIKNMLNLSKEAHVKRIFFSSSSEVYGESVEFPQHEETTPLNSRLPYAIVKNVGESFCKSYQKEFGLDYTVFRFFNTYGPKQSNDFVISRFLRLALRHEPIYVYGDGSQSRTFCYVDDNTNCIATMLKHNLMVNEVINIGAEINYPILQLAQTIVKLTNSSSQIEFTPPLKEGDMSRRLPEISKMKSIINGDPITLEKGISMILENDEFMRSI